jgi:hypothetical protein
MRTFRRNREVVQALRRRRQGHQIHRRPITQISVKILISGVPKPPLPPLTTASSANRKIGTVMTRTLDEIRRFGRSSGLGSPSMLFTTPNWVHNHTVEVDHLSEHACAQIAPDSPDSLMCGRWPAPLPLCPIGTFTASRAA